MSSSADRRRLAPRTSEDEALFIASKYAQNKLILEAKFANSLNGGRAVRQTMLDEVAEELSVKFNVANRSRKYVEQKLRDMKKEARKFFYLQQNAKNVENGSNGKSSRTPPEPIRVMIEAMGDELKGGSWDDVEHTYGSTMKLDGADDQFSSDTARSPYPSSGRSSPLTQPITISADPPSSGRRTTTVGGGESGVDRFASKLMDAKQSKRKSAAANGNTVVKNGGATNTVLNINIGNKETNSCSVDITGKDFLSNVTNSSLMGSKANGNNGDAELQNAYNQSLSSFMIGGIGGTIADALFKTGSGTDALVNSDSAVSKILGADFLKGLINSGGDELGKLLIDASGADEQSKSLLKTIAASSMLFQPSFSYNAAYLSDSVGGINSAATAPNQIVKKTINGGKAALQRKAKEELKLSNPCSPFSASTSSIDSAMQTDEEAFLHRNNGTAARNVGADATSSNENYDASIKKIPSMDFTKPTDKRLSESGGNGRRYAPYPTSTATSASTNGVMTAARKCYNNNKTTTGNDSSSGVDASTVPLKFNLVPAVGTAHHCAVRCRRNRVAISSSLRRRLLLEEINASKAFAMMCNTIQKSVEDAAKSVELSHRLQSDFIRAQMQFATSTFGNLMATEETMTDENQRSSHKTFGGSSAETLDPEKDIDENADKTDGHNLQAEASTDEEKTNMESGADINDNSMTPVITTKT